MQIDLSKASKAEIYYLMTQCIVPRPVAWVTSKNSNDTYNLAPFSYFNGICSEPPLISLSMGYKREGIKKDTWVNIDEREEFVINIPSVNQAQQVSMTASPLGLGESEIDKFNIQLANVEGQDLPYIKDSLISLFCTKHKILELGKNNHQALIIGEIKSILINDSIVSLDENEHVKVDVTKLNPLMVVSSQDYGELGKLLDR